MAQVERMRPRIPKPKKRQREHRCFKIKYFSLESAEEAAKAHGSPFSPYYCEECGVHHLTTSKRNFHNWALTQVTVIQRRSTDEE